MLTSLSETDRLNVLERRPGQSLILFTMLITVFFGFLALAIDLGFLFGQRRFDQNGSDAAALAAAQYLASNVSPYNPTGSQVFFYISDSLVYQKARQYAGLSPTGTSNVPTGLNQNPGLNASNQLAVTLEYSADGGQSWCYSPSEPSPPPRAPAVPVCSLYSGTYPPLPGSAAYEVRVTVSSLTSTFFAQTLGITNLGPSGPQSNTNAPACLPPSGNSGMLTCAQTIALIAGAPSSVGQANLIPMAVPNCQLSPPVLGQLYELWGSSGNTCAETNNVISGTFNYGAWPSIADLSSETTWCNDPSGGSGSNPDYIYRPLLPSASRVASGVCASLATPADTTWQRSGYVADSSYPNATYPNSGIVNYDLQWWIAKGFNGTIRPSSTASLQTGQVPDGNKLPTYQSANTSQSGNQGQNIAASFYCSSSGVTATSCPTTVEIAGTYYFAKDQLGFYDLCPDDFGTIYGVGCRDANVLTFENTEKADPNPSYYWRSTKNTPDRITVANILNFRIYCDHDNSGFCDLAPKSVQNTASNSTVWGRFAAPFITPGNCNNCNGGPTIYGNTARLSQ